MNIMAQKLKLKKHPDPNFVWAKIDAATLSTLIASTFDACKPETFGSLFKQFFEYVSETRGKSLWELNNGEFLGALARWTVKKRGLEDQYREYLDM